MLRQHLGERDAHVGDAVRAEAEQTRQQLVSELLPSQARVLQNVVAQLRVAAKENTTSQKK